MTSPSYTGVTASLPEGIESAPYFKTTKVAEWSLQGFLIATGRDEKSFLSEILDLSKFKPVPLDVRLFARSLHIFYNGIFGKEVTAIAKDQAQASINRSIYRGKEQLIVQKGYGEDLENDLNRGVDPATQFKEAKPADSASDHEQAVAGQKHPRDPEEESAALPKAPCRSLSSTIVPRDMVQDDRDLPHPFQESSTDYADDEQVDATEADDLPNPFQESNTDYADDEQVDAIEADDSSEQESSSEINKSSHIRLKDPWHTLATSAISLFHGESVVLPSMETRLEEPDLDRQKLYALVLGHLVSTQGEMLTRKKYDQTRCPYLKRALVGLSGIWDLISAEEDMAASAKKNSRRNPHDENVFSRQDLSDAKLQCWMPELEVKDELTIAVLSDIIKITKEPAQHRPPSSRRFQGIGSGFDGYMGQYIQVWSPSEVTLSVQLGRPGNKSSDT
ncbi:hypothetical protein B0O80DRAFT_504687 [Mortierella sp. GBAus27b]|nr:hypothetical protein B0O80DRAFT_504687 [Mortierella sp. GBAus27b]